MKKLISAVMVLWASIIVTGFSTSPTNDTGAELYTRNCAPCHGADGTKGRWGAKNLQLTLLGSEQLLDVISEGRKIMPAWKKRFNKDQIILVRDYVINLRPAKKQD